MGGLLAQPASYPLLVNARCYVPGRLDTRAGIVAVNSNALGAVVHSLKRLNDPLPGAPTLYAIIAAAGATLWVGQVGAVASVFNQIDAGYSGNPLGFVAYRPPNSPESWLYISDSQQMRKARVDGLVWPQGIAPPLTAPTVDFAQPLLTLIDDFNEAATTGWSNGGTAGALSANPTSRINDTLDAPFNTGPGWAEYIENAGTALLAGYGRGMLLALDASPGTPETVEVMAIYPPTLNTTILAIMYDSGVTGPCCLVPAAPSALVTNLALRGVLSKLARRWDDPFTAGGNLQVQPNTIFTLGTSPVVEDVLVLSSTPGPLGTYSVRTATSVNHAAGDPLTAVSSLRMYPLAAHANPVPVSAGYFRSTIAAGIGTISNAALTVDLSIISSRPTQPTDEIHLSVRLDVPENLIEGRIIFDVDSANHDFSHNYYYASFRASDLISAVVSTSTTQAAIQASIPQAQIDAYNAMHPGGYYQQVFNAGSPTAATTLPSASTQAGTGTSQWTELFIPISSLIRVGTDTSRTLANVKGVEIYFNVSASTVCDVHGLYLKGSYGPDVGTVGNDYYYRFRRRSTLTGAKSNPSPYNRSGIRPHSQRVAVTMPGDATEGDQLDVFRWGGSVTAAANGVVPWLYVGSVANPGAGTTATFNDDLADSDILNAEVLEFDNQQPYATLDTPRQGTCTVVGTSVLWVSGDKFNVNWAPGSLIEINGIPYTLYAQPASSDFLEIVESATTLGSETVVTAISRPTAFDNPDPTLGGTAFNNPAFAFDANLATAATVGGALLAPQAALTVTQVHRQNDWTNLDAIKVNDGVFAQVTLYGSNANVNKSSIIHATGFFVNNPISLTDTITGISVAVVHKQFAGTSAVYDDDVKLLNLGVSTDHSKPTPWTNGVTETYVYGGPTDTWGGTPPTPALLNSPNFGVEFAIECTQLPGNGAIAGVTYITVTVYTSPGSGVTPGTHASCAWRALPTVGASAFDTAKLSVAAFAVDLTIEQNATAYVQYSLDGGATWNTLWNNHNHFATASDGSYAPITDTVNIPLNQNLALVKVRSYGSVPGGDLGSEYISINEVYVTVTYTPSVLVSVPFILRQPTLLAQPMYAQWGPFLGFLLAVGDPYQPGVLHCTKPNQPDEGSDLLDVEITSPSEPLMNGCMYGNGASFVWSSERMFQLVSSSDLGLQFTPTGGASQSVPFVAQEVPGSEGLFSPWAFCVGDAMYYLSKRGIMATSGGTPTSITDPALSLLFPRDGRPGEPVTLGSVTFQPPDFSQTQALRLFWDSGHVKFAYLDLDGKRQVIVYSVILGVWTQDDYVTSAGDPLIASCYSEEGQSVNRNLVGGLNYIYQETGSLETGLVAGWQCRMAQVSDLPGFIHGRDGYLGLMSITPVIMDVMVDGALYTHTVASTGGAYAKPYVPLHAMKGKAWEWALHSGASVRLFLRDCRFRLKSWGGDTYQAFEPFRDLNRETKP